MFTYVTCKINDSTGSKDMISYNNRQYSKIVSVCFDNETLKKGSIVLLNIESDGCPLFIKITQTFKSNVSAHPLSPYGFYCYGKICVDNVP